MFTPDAEELFDMVKVSLPVVISSVEGYDHPEPEPTPEPEEQPRSVDTDEETTQPEPEDNSADADIQPEPETIENNSEDQTSGETEKPKGFWDKIKSFFGNLFS